MVRRAVRPALVLAFLLAVAVGTAGALRALDWTSVRAIAEPSRIGLAASAFAANSVAMLLAMASWRALLLDLDPAVNRLTAARIFYVGFLAKFAPGRLWSLLANIRMGRTAGVMPARMATVYVLNLVVSALTGLTVGLVAAPAILGRPAAALVLAAAPVIACLIRPDLVNRWAGAAARSLRRPPPGTAASDRGVRHAIWAQAGCWLAAGVQLWLLAVAWGAPPLRSLPVCVGAFGLATVAGIAVVVAPDGLGVREGVLLVALAAVMPLPAAGAVAVASRLLCTLSELASAGVALLAVEVTRHRAVPGVPSVPGGPDESR